MTDVTQLILDDHETFRRQFAQLDSLRDDPARAAEVWTPLAELLETHASAEEEHFYPALLQHAPDSEDETNDAIGDHDAIRDGIRRAGAAEVGSDEWWEGIKAAREANEEHMSEEEEDDLPDFREHVSAELRAEIGSKFQQFKDYHAGARGLSGANKDPDEFVREHS